MSRIDFKKLRELLPGLRKNVLMKRYASFKIGGKAKYFFVARRKENLINAILVARKYNLPFFILGEGTNLLVSDRGFKGLIIKVENKKYKIPRTRTSSVRGKQNNLLYAEAGVPMRVLVRETTERGLGGLEWAAGIPGTIGGAIRGNAGAFGAETGDNILWVETLDKKGNIKKISRKKSNFSYRSSIFKKRNLIIISALIKLKKKNKKTIKKTVKDCIKYRRERLPLNYPSAGSVFKNYDIKKISRRLKKFFSRIIKKDPFPIIPAAYLISEAGLKGFKIGRAQISKKHPNFIINLGGAKAKDVIKLINLAKKRVRNKFGIILEEEIQYLGS